MKKMCGKGDLLFCANKVAQTQTHGTRPRLVPGLRLGVHATIEALLPPHECLVLVLPAMAHEKLGQEGRIPVLRDDLPILVEERVAARLGVLLELGVIPRPAVAGDLVQTSTLPIREWLVDEAVSAHGTR